ncbi:disulfide isomerase DsbC N-terminal domain-containing protein [Geomesophilobacter sediminis]|uniref:Disulphide bond isomerase DsbC/G N-terminal domain-containing protein n=1 Tax=Geomesophilobacter sediminis TaxID=2798584 RepID=A0A8J7SCW7_9BACT|nr:disulfide isomerase DsbC N-terminal domain-containing protein [Geomesophilobacter sediminis]MBJ6727454.1 hypothetical protein [Geomesophilobacter sediminis]
MTKKYLAMLVFVLLAGCSSAPSKEQVKESMKKLIPVDFQVVDVRAVSQVPGLVEVVIKAGNQPMVIYMDKKAKYVLSGSLMEVDTKKNLTRETVTKYQTK